MPPRPRHSVISNCGNLSAISSGEGGGDTDGLSSAPAMVRDASAWRSRHAGHNNCGESVGNCAPQSGQVEAGWISVMVVWFSLPQKRGGKIVTGIFLSGQHGEKRLHFLLHRIRR